MITITGPIQPALDHTKRILFEPFSWGKWFILGFCAFLSQLGSGGFNGNALRGSNWSQDGEMAQWAMAHLPFVLLLGGLALVLVLGLIVLFQWLGGRGAFMFLDGVARNHPAVAEPWTRFRDRGNEVFRFRLLLILVSLVFFAAVAGAGFLLLWPALRGGETFHSVIVPAIVLGVLLLAGLVVLTAVSLLLKDFVVPIMYRRNLGLPDAWQVLHREILPGHGWIFVGFYLMTIVLWIPAAILAVLTICLTCCVALLPYLSSVVLLPISVFFRCYSLCFLEQFEGDWRMLEVETVP